MNWEKIEREFAQMYMDGRVRCKLCGKARNRRGKTGKPISSVIRPAIGKDGQPTIACLNCIRSPKDATPKEQRETVKKLNRSLF